MDHRLVIARDLGFDVLLPNPAVPAVDYDHSWQFTITMDKRFHQFGGDVRMFSCDMAGRMLRIGTTRSNEDVWLCLVPRESFDAPVPPHEVKLSKKSTVMKPALSLAMYASILYAMQKAHYQAINMKTPYPKISSEAEFKRTFDFRYVLYSPRATCHARTSPWGLARTCPCRCFSAPGRAPGGSRARVPLCGLPRTDEPRGARTHIALSTF